MERDEMDAMAFASFAEAKAAADRLMPRRKHNRPYPVKSGYDSARAGADRWIVWVGNVVLLADGTMYDYQRKVTVRS
jgi:hypothetical protein